jgi:hypothetical protein
LPIIPFRRQTHGLIGPPTGIYLHDKTKICLNCPKLK